MGNGLLGWKKSSIDDKNDSLLTPTTIEAMFDLEKACDDVTLLIFVRFDNTSAKLDHKKLCDRTRKPNLTYSIADNDTLKLHKPKTGKVVPSLPEIRGSMDKPIRLTLIKNDDGLEHASARGDAKGPIEVESKMNDKRLMQTNNCTDATASIQAKSNETEIRPDLTELCNKAVLPRCTTSSTDKNMVDHVTPQIASSMPMCWSIFNVGMLSTFRLSDVESCDSEREKKHSNSIDPCRV